MSEPTEDEYRDWKDLLQSPGWTRLQAYAATEWDASSLERHVLLALDGADALAVGKLRQIVAGKRAVAKVLAHPQARIDVLKRDQGEPAAHEGRRGAL